MHLTFRRSYLPIGNVALDALEHWFAVMPRKIRPHLPAVLPSLNEYLRLDENSYEKKV